MTNPTPQQIKDARQASGLTQSAAASSVHVGIRAWQRWEAGDRKMPMNAWVLFIGLYPDAKIAAAETTQTSKI